MIYNVQMKPIAMKKPKTLHSINWEFVLVRKRMTVVSWIIRGVFCRRRRYSDFLKRGWEQET